MYHRLRDDLILYALVCGAVAFGSFARTSEFPWVQVSFGTFSYRVLSAAAFGLVETVLLTVRCRIIHHRASRHSSEVPSFHIFMQQHFHLVTRSILLAAIGVVVIYDGYWRLYESYSEPYPNDPFYLELFWMLGYGVGIAAIIWYGSALIRQIRQIYQVTLLESANYLFYGLLPEFLMYGTMGGCILLITMLFALRGIS
jgi:hypothetical protein